MGGELRSLVVAGVDSWLCHFAAGLPQVPITFLCFLICNMGTLSMTASKVALRILLLVFTPHVGSSDGTVTCVPCSDWVEVMTVSSLSFSPICVVLRTTQQELRPRLLATYQLSQDPQLSHRPRLLAQGCQAMCACCLMVLNLGVICYVATEN